VIGIKIEVAPRLGIPAQGAARVRERVRAIRPDHLHQRRRSFEGPDRSFRSLDDKPALTLDFDKFATTQRFHGLSRIHLNNSVEDPGYLNEAIGAELFRAAACRPRVCPCAGGDQRTQAGFMF